MNLKSLITCTSNRASVHVHVREGERLSSIHVHVHVHVHVYVFICTYNLLVIVQPHQLCWYESL